MIYIWSVPEIGGLIKVWNSTVEPFLTGTIPEKNKETIAQSQEKLCFAWDVSKLVPDLSSTGSLLSGP